MHTIGIIQGGSRELKKELLRFSETALRCSKNQVFVQALRKPNKETDIEHERLQIKSG